MRGKKRPNSKEPEPPFMVTGGEKQAITQTQGGNERGWLPPMSWVDWTEWRRGGGNSVSWQTVAKSVNLQRQVRLTAIVSHTVDSAQMNTEPCSSRFSLRAGRVRCPSHCNRFSFLCRPRAGDTQEITLRSGDTQKHPYQRIWDAASRNNQWC